jgi:hypothetical protein
MAFCSRIVIYILCTAALIFSAKAFAADDEYLKILEGEAEDLKLDQSGQLNEGVQQEVNGYTEKINKKDWKWEGGLDGDVLPPGLAQDEFATILEDNFYGSFVFYRKLNSNVQKTVYYHYSKASPAHLDDIRQDILDHLKR